LSTSAVVDPSAPGSASPPAQPPAPVQPPTPAAPSTPAPPRSMPEVAGHALFVNRELSWLAFIERVLNEALKPSWPLLERVKFLAIYWSNLDEFFMIRVSGLHEQLEAALIDTTPDGLSPRDQLTRIGQIVRQQGEVAAALLSGDLLPALAGKQIHVRDWK